MAPAPPCTSALVRGNRTRERAPGFPPVDHSKQPGARARSQSSPQLIPPSGSRL